MEYYFITGTSSGIGLALAEVLLRRENVRVYGIARTNQLVHERFTFCKTDLLDVEALNHFRFPEVSRATKLVLVNNAGMLGKVGYVGQVSAQNYTDVFTVNLTAVAVLTNEFMRVVADNKVPAVIANISSGAGKNPIDGWSAYCASKAGLDMFSKVIAEELAISGQNRARIFSISPGVVDTKMQDQIRTAPAENFSRIQQFHEYKSTGQLADPHLIAQKLLIIFDSPEKFPETLISLRDIQNQNQHTN